MNRCSDCCEIPIPLTPEETYNRPGLTELRYRVGTYTTFRRAMIESIGGKPALKEWTAGYGGDYGIALLEMWAYISDILTFYQERIANEAYLRTAVHEDTVRRLARRLDYHPAPGAAAETLLAFTLEENTSIEIPVGLRVQSVPGQDEQPQKFETIESVEASDALNNAPVVPPPVRTNLFAEGAVRATLRQEESADITEAINEGDSLVMFDKERGQLEEKQVAAFHEQADGRIEMEWTPAVQATQTRTRVFTYGSTFRLFGYNAPMQTVHVSPDDTRPNGVRTTLTSVENARFEFTPVEDKNTTSIHLDSSYDDVKSGDRLLIDAGENGGLAVVTVVQVAEQSVAKLARRDADLGDLAAALKGQGAVTKLQVKGLSEPLAGDRRTAVLYKLSPPEILFWLTGQARQQRGEKIFSFDDIVSVVELPFGPEEPIQLDKPRYGSFLANIYEQERSSSEDEQKRTGRSDLLQNVGGLIDTAEFDFLSVPEQLGSEGSGVQQPTPNSGWEIPEVISGRTLCVRSNMHMATGSLVGRTVFLNADDRQTGESTAHPAVVEEAREQLFGSREYLELTLEETFDSEFQTAGARLSGNVAGATHGETVAGEVLGSGSAQEEFQSHALAKSPVTFTREPEAKHGAENTLELRVDGILWQETERLYNHSAKDRIYTTRIDDEGVMHVQFGDGEMGKRPSTGHRNITARYRQGHGAQGNVDAHTLRTLLDRPKGLSEVTNPQRADKGADRETREGTRENAPNTVRTFDRIVSLRDFEDAAREYVGIAKARAHWQWDGTQRTIYLTVASDEGRALSPAARNDLRTHLDGQRDPHRGLRIIDYTAVPITVAITLQTRDDHRDQDVRKAAVAAVRGFFSFDDRSLGRDIHRSDLYHLLQTVDGVVAIRIDKLSAPGKTLNSVGRLPISADELAALHSQSPRIRSAALDR